MCKNSINFYKEQRS